MKVGKRKEGDGVESNVVSLAEWRRVQRRLERMTLPDLAMTTHQLIDLVIDLTSHLEKLRMDLDKYQSDR
jgi:hypothetical protein